MPTTVVERYGSLSATGVATEPGFGTTTVPSTFLPMSGNSLELDPGLFWPKVMMGQRDLNIFPVYGQYKNAGSLNGPLFPSNAISLLAGAIGADASAGNGVVGTTGTGSTTVAGGGTVGSSSITVAAATGFTTGQVVQIGVNGTGPTTTAECRKITVTGVTFALDQPLNYAHANGVAVIGVVAPYTHTIVQANQLPSFTIEKNIGGFESLQFSGSRINKFDLSSTNGNQEATIAVDFMSQSSAVLSTPSAITVTDESPFVFAETNLSLSSQSVIQTTTADLSIENGLKDTYTFNGSHNLQFLTPVTRQVTFKTDVVFTSLDDPTWGYWTQMTSTPSTNFPVSLSYVHPGTGGSITFTMPKGRLKTYTDAIKIDDIVISTLTIDLGLQLSNLTTIGCVVVNSLYLPF